MTYYKRLLEASALNTLARGKSLLLLGPRQTGKTTFVREQLKPDIEISFAKASDRLRYEQEPRLLEYEILDLLKRNSKIPTIFIDEIQKIPGMMDTVQYIIDQKKAQFILSGSSARKLKNGNSINLLPGRVVLYTLSPFLYQEISSEYSSLEDLLLYGALPGITTEPNKDNKEEDLRSYVATYLQDEIRAESVVRNIGHFAQFLQLAAGESNKQINMSRLSQDVGVAVSTISSYFEILVDCLIAHKINPLTESSTKRRLIKSSKYLFFDLGVRRVCANEGTKLPVKVLGDYFEQYIGLQLLSNSSIKAPQAKIRYWRDSAGPEIDFVIEFEKYLIPIEVKYSETPSLSDSTLLAKFMQEYQPNVPAAYLVCRTSKRYLLPNGITVLPWQELPLIFEEMISN